jgi:hypothetical protein
MWMRLAKTARFHLTTTARIAVGTAVLRVVGRQKGVVGVRGAAAGVRAKLGQVDQHRTKGMRTRLEGGALGTAQVKTQKAVREGQGT